MIHITCDICHKEPDPQDNFAFEATKKEILTSLAGKDLVPQKQMKTDMYQICKSCFYKHLSKLFNEKGK